MVAFPQPALPDTQRTSGGRQCQPMNIHQPLGHCSEQLWSPVPLPGWKEQIGSGTIRPNYVNSWEIEFHLLVSFSASARLFAAYMVPVGVLHLVAAVSFPTCQQT